MNHRPVLSRCFRLSAWLLILFVGLVGSAVYAQRKTKTRAQLERQRVAAMKQIEETSKMLKETSNSAKHQLNQLNVLTSEIATRKAVLATMQKELQEMEIEQAGLMENIRVLKKDVQSKQDKYALAIRHMYQWRSGYEQIMFIFSAENMQEGVRRVRYLNEYGAWRKRQAEELTQKRQQTEAAEAALRAKKEERQALMNERQAQQDRLQSQQQRQTELVNDLNKKKKQLQSELASQRKQAQALDAKIQQIIEEEARRAAEERRRQEELRRKQQKKAAQASKKNGGSSSQSAQQQQAAPVYNDYDSKLSGTFAQNKGKMPYPVNGSYTVIGRFGKQKHETMKFVETINNGIIIQTRAGAEACAVFEGVVNSVIQMPGYNISVLVSHGQYFSVYNNLSKVYVKKGQKLKIRDRIGLIYTDSEGDGLTKMDFQIWNGTQKQDPQLWLKR